MADGSERDRIDVDVELRADIVEDRCGSRVPGVREDLRLMFDDESDRFGRVGIVRASDVNRESTHLEVVTDLDHPFSIRAWINCAVVLWALVGGTRCVDVGS